MKYDRGWAYPDIDDFMRQEMKDDGSYQASHLTLALKYVTEWSCAIDGGGHVGTWARPMAAKFARVIAVEPSPDTFEALVANMATFACVNVEPMHVALGAVPGHVTMQLDGRGLELKNTGARYVAETAAGVARITIDSLNLQALGFLKLDIEGSEPLALMGARATLKRCQPIVLFENKGLCRRFGLAPDAPQQVLTKAGYRQLERAGCDLIWGPA